MNKVIRSFSVIAILLSSILFCSFEGCGAFYDITVTGKVVSEDGEPLAGMKVSSFYVDTAYYEYNYTPDIDTVVHKYDIGVAFTDNNGEYSIFSDCEDGVKPQKLIQVIVNDANNVYAADSVLGVYWWKVSPGSRKKRDSYKGGFRAEQNFTLKKNN